MQFPLKYLRERVIQNYCDIFPKYLLIILPAKENYTVVRETQVLPFNVAFRSTFIAYRVPAS